MSLPPPDLQLSFFQVSELAHSLFKGGDRYSLFREHILPALEPLRDELESLYCSTNGRPAIDPVLLSGVTLLQFMEKIPDRRAVEFVRLHLGWKFALNLEIDASSFHATSLVYFRQRLLEGGKERMVFDAVLDLLGEHKLIKKQSKQRLDSSHILGCVAKMSRIEIVRETIRLFLESHSGLLEEDGASSETHQRWTERYLESEIDFQKLSKEKLQWKLTVIGEDAWAMLKWLQTQDKTVQEHPRSLLLKKVFDEQFEVDEQTIVARKTDVAGGVRNPHDPEAEWCTKGKGKEWTGYKVQVTETAPEEPRGKEEQGKPTEQFIVDVTTTPATTSDYAGMEKALSAQLEHQQDQPRELYVDAGYISDDTLAEAKEKNLELKGPARPPGNPKKLLPVDQFDIHITERKAVCPAGHTSTQCSLINDQHNQSAYYRFEWGTLCDSCALQKQCTKAKNGRRLVSVGIHHDLLQERRREMKTETFQTDMKQRNAIEGTISELMRQGMRRTPYRGLAKTALANYFTATVCNINRWFRRMEMVEAKGI
jgi:transposase